MTKVSTTTICAQLTGISYRDGLCPRVADDIRGFAARIAHAHDDEMRDLRAQVARLTAEIDKLNEESLHVGSLHAEALVRAESQAARADRAESRLAEVERSRERERAQLGYALGRPKRGDK